MKIVHFVEHIHKNPMIQKETQRESKNHSLMVSLCHFNRTAERKQKTRTSQLQSFDIYNTIEKVRVENIFFFYALDLFFEFVYIVSDQFSRTYTK